MNAFLTFLLFLVFSFAAYSEQGTMSPDDNEVSDSEASLSGYEAQEEDVLLIEEEEYDPLENEGGHREEELYLEEEPSEPLPSEQ